MKKRSELVLFFVIILNTNHLRADFRLQTVCKMHNVTYKRP
jgi:hypothetical protein